jgi:D-alanine-D-alanine ligase-like ATP-grasp enzyme
VAQLWRASHTREALRGVDVAINVIHGEYGEDGRLHEILDSLGVPYTGSDKNASILAFNKARSKQAVKKVGIKTPRAMLIDIDEMQKATIEELAYNIFRTFPHPAIVKPVSAAPRLASPSLIITKRLSGRSSRHLKLRRRRLIEEYIRAHSSFGRAPHLQ